MASQVTVIDPSARRHVVKVTPGKYLNDILQEACTKFRLDPNQYGLKNNNRQLDLSRTYRLSGLSSGAKLELILLSRSASVVSVALQLPESEAKGLPSARLLDKFPSTTTLWLILRKFEAGVAGGLGSSKNFTGRGRPRTGSGSSGAGRLFYETPVLHIVGRDYVSFTDLQKSLGQIGINAGSVLLKLSFQPTNIPLEEAMDQIGQYFKSVEDDLAAGTHADNGARTEPVPAATGTEAVQERGNLATDPQSLQNETGKQELGDRVVEGDGKMEVDQEVGRNAEQQTQKGAPIASEASSPQNDPNGQSGTGIQASDSRPASTIPGVSSRPVTVFAPPSSTTPQAARTAYNPKDYEPTIDHAKLHQARLASSAVNKRLPTDAEIAANEAAQAQKQASIQTVEIKIRFPDLSSTVSHFNREDTAETLYSHVQSLLNREHEPFSLSQTMAKGTRILPKGQEKLIAELGLAGKVLVTVIWEEGASLEARIEPVLKAEVVQKAKHLQIQEVGEVDVKESEEAEAPKKDNGGKGKTKGMPKWFKMPGKK